LNILIFNILGTAPRAAQGGFFGDAGRSKKNPQPRE
jgi:hypothetical protein